MNRRNVLVWLFGAPFIARLLSQPTVYGYMDCERWYLEGFCRRGAKVLLNDVDITNRCRWFDDRTGRAECLILPAHVDDLGNMVVEVLKGRIEVIG